MTVLGNSLLNQYALEHKDLNSPKEILEYMDRNVRTRLNQHGIQLSSPEGMDMSMTIIDFKSLNLKFSSARLPLYISHGENFDQLVGDRLSIGGDEILDKKFTEKSIKVKKGDVLYMSTDGFQDQFGGKDDKKFMKLHFRNLLASMNGLSMENQKIKLVNTFNDWKEFNLQTDDILILGIRI
jgi:serine phosphatase RsbU (regulator of sigma subunit)